MILELEIKKFAVLEDLRLEFGPALNVITGETGTGKSLLVRALSFLLGQGSLEEGEVQGVFRPPPAVRKLLEEDGFEADGELYISRSCKPGSRTVTRLNGTMIPAAKLKTLSYALAEIYGQHAHLALLQSKTPLALLDAFGGSAVLSKREEAEACYGRWQALQKQKREMEEKAGGKERQVDLLRYEINEIREAGLVAGEEEKLREEKEKLSKLERLQNILAETLALVENADLLKIEKNLDALAPFGKKLEPWLSRLNQFGYEWMELREALKDSREFFTAPPERLEQVVERLDALSRLRKKYGAAAEEILDYARARQKDLEALEGWEENLSGTARELTACEERMEALCDELSRWRASSAEKLNGLMEKELQALAIPQARFQVHLEKTESWSSTGRDRAEFLVCANPGGALLPIQETASGGELSRILLALRVILSSDSVPTLIFDETDAGLGGETAFHVAERIRRLSRDKQVLCVTHLHQVAAAADHHFYLEKQTAQGRTRVTAQALDADRKVFELARMMAGERAGQAAVRHAQELLKGVHERSGDTSRE